MVKIIPIENRLNDKGFIDEVMSLGNLMSVIQIRTRMRSNNGEKSWNA